MNYRTSYANINYSNKTCIKGLIKFNIYGPLILDSKRKVIPLRCPITIKLMISLFPIVTQNGSFHPNPPTLLYTYFNPLVNIFRLPFHPFLRRPMESLKWMRRERVAIKLEYQIHYWWNKKYNLNRR